MHTYTCISKGGRNRRDKIDKHVSPSCKKLNTCIYVHNIKKPLH